MEIGDKDEGVLEETISVLRDCIYEKGDRNGNIECPYSGAKVPWMCVRFCNTCIQKLYPNRMRDLKI